MKPLQLRPGQPARDALLARARKVDLAAIHAAARQLGMDTADKDPSTEYRRMLATQSGEGVCSAADLTDAGRKRVRAWLQRELNRRRPSIGQLIETLWFRLGQAGKLRDPSSAGLAAFLETRYRVSHPRWLPADQAAEVVEALKAWLARPKSSA